MKQEYSPDEKAVAAHYCWPIGVYDGVSESVAVRRPTRTSSGSLHLNTTWHQCRIELCKRELRAKGLLA